MSEPWFRGFFRGDWQRGAAQAITRESGEVQATLIEKTLALKAGDRVLDTVCGNGRHAVALAKHGYDLTGADLSEAQIDSAKELARSASVEVRFLVHDMRDLPFEAEFDAAYNVFTSFGYFEGRRMIAARSARSAAR